MGSQILIPVFADERENYAEPMTLFSILSVGILLAPNVFLEEHRPDRHKMSQEELGRPPMD